MNQTVLLEMLDIAIGALAENENCYYCGSKDCDFCFFHSDCKDGIFNGLEAMAKKNIKDRANNKINRRAS